MNIEHKVHVCHKGTVVLCMGTFKACMLYKENNILVDYYEVNTVEDYGHSCYDAGYNDGTHDSVWD